jgi:hypothetical protein
MGGGSNDFLQSGWVGRFVKDNLAPKVYPKDFPNPDYLDPPALEFGNEISLIFHQEEQIPVSVSIYNPVQFFNLVQDLPGFDDVPNLDPRGIPPSSLDGTLYSQEMNWILGLEEKTEDYHKRLFDVYTEGKKKDQGVVYPETYPFTAPSRWLKNKVSPQLQIVSNLISGGSKTKVYLLKVGGFDTHAMQVESNNPSTGIHASLLYHISSAMEAFQKDLKSRGIADRVLTITTSEFGRRIESNGSWGTDHGIGGPMFIFGEKLVPGLLGNNPDLNQDNVGLQFDYRQIYASIMKDWFCVDPNFVDNQLFVGDYEKKGEKLPIVDLSSLGVQEFFSQRFYLEDCVPNPVVDKVTFGFYINQAMSCSLRILDLGGNVVVSIFENKNFGIGKHQIETNLSDLKSGSYIYQIIGDNKILNQSKKLILK